MANEPQDKLEEIRREVIEGRNLVIKTDNQLKTLHAELKIVSKRQDDFVRRQWVSSAVAYAAFVGLCVAGAFAISNARTASAGMDRERFEKQIKDLTAQVDALKAQDATVASWERSAGEVYKLMSTGGPDDRLKGIDALSRLDQSKLSAFSRQVLQDRAVALRKEAGAAFLERGKAAFRKQDYPGTVTELSRFMAMNPVEEDAVEASYYLGNALIQTRKSEDAIPHLQRYIAGDKRAKNRDFAMLLLMQAFDATNQREKAVEVARDGVNSYPNSEFSSSFRAHLQLRNKEPAPAPVPAEEPKQPLKPAAPAPGH